jgi:4-amino-4-deoxy-L-arabinose transferase-like glycosyltransferase
VDRRLVLGVAAIAVFALAVRIWYAIAVAGRAPLVGDGLEFHELANVLADGRGYITPIVHPGEAPTATAHKPPLYPLVLALPSTLAGNGYRVHQVVSALVGTGTVVVLAVLALRLAGRRAALLAAAIGAAYPVFVATDASLRSESLYGLLVALALLAAYRAFEQPSPGRLVQLGVVIALAALTRSEALALLALLALPLVWRSGARRRWPRLALVAVSCGLVLAPWLIRNWIVFDRPVGISTNYGDLIAGANCPATYFGPHPGGWAFSCALGVSGGNEAEMADRLRARGLRYARDHADRLPAILAARALRPWGLYEPSWEVELRAGGEGADRTTDWLGLVTFWALTPLAVCGLLVLRRRGQPLFILLAPFALVLLVSLTAYGVLRFRGPADVAVIVLAAVGLDALHPSARRQRARPG